MLLLYATAQPPISGQLQPTIAADQLLHSTIPLQVSSLRRAITPSPEKATINSTRRAMTPTPNRPIGDYQNLNVIQSKIFSGERTHNETDGVDAVDGSVQGKDLQSTAIQKMHLQRSLSNESTPMADGLSIPDHLNQPRRRDSGNWSGDRNSASSSSSTTLEGSYLYLMNKRSDRNGSHPPSPTRSSQSGCSPVPSNSSGNSAPMHVPHQFFDAGYDSYSLSSTDSYPPKHHAAQLLAKIPESVVLSGECERLCKEADQLLEKSRYSEEIHDLETALILCNTAAGMARAAMDAPYSNPHTMTFARMKHNTCVMRARSLHRRLLIEKNGIIAIENLPNDAQYVTSNDIRNNGTLRQMRMTNGKEMFSSASSSVSSSTTIPSTTNKNIEIYATLPKRGKLPFKFFDTEDAIQPADIQPAPVAKPERESRSLNIFGRGRRNEEKEKRSRSEDRNKHGRDAEQQLLANAKDTLKKHKEDKDEKIEKEKPNKKQHKVRRKILMGGLIRRKNRSMPDLTEANVQETEKENATAKASLSMISTALDDSSLMLGSSANSENGSSMSGYLSEGHFEYQTIVTGNPNLERSKLMRKNVQNGAANRQQLMQVKVPPPPPVRTNSTLSQQQLQLHQQQMEKEALPLSAGSIQPFHQANVSLISNMSSNTSMSEDSCQTIITTCAQVHHEQSPQQKPLTKDSSVDEIDSRLETNLELPPYPSPPTSTCHSRQASEEFPPPPPTELIEHTVLTPTMENTIQNQRPLDTFEGTTSILAQLQQRQQMLKQQKMRVDAENKRILDQKSVRDLAARFEQVKMSYSSNDSLDRTSEMSSEQSKIQIRTNMSGLLEPNVPPAVSVESQDEVDCVPASIKTSLGRAPAQFVAQKLPASQIAEEIREVEMLNNVVHQTLHPNGFSQSIGNMQSTKPQERTKKKSVSFCDQVILVATADDDEDDDFIPNPILERVLRTANYSNGTDVIDCKTLQQQQQNILRLQNEPSNRQQMVVPLQGSPSENNCRQDMRSEAQKQLMISQQRPPMSQGQNKFNGREDVDSIEPPKSMPQPIEQHQRAQVFSAVAAMQQQQQQRHLQMNGFEANHAPLPSPYMHVPYTQMQSNANMNFMKARPQNYPAASNILPPVSNANGVYQLPPMPKYHPQQLHAAMNNGKFMIPPQQQNQQAMAYHMAQQQQQSQMNGMQMYVQRVPLSHNAMPNYHPIMNPMTKGPAVKKVSFEPGTKGEAEANEPIAKVNGFPMQNGKMATPTSSAASPTNQMSPTLTSVTAIPTRVFNNSAIVKASAKAVQCNLCRKKHVIAPAVYCADCEFYMSRFQPRV